MNRTTTAILNNYMKKIIFALCFINMFALLTSCHKEADYSLGVGESFTLRLYSLPPGFWEWENQSQTDVVSMHIVNEDEYCSDDTVQAIDYFNYPIGFGAFTIFAFTGEKKGYAVVRMVNEQNQSRVNFTVQVE